MILEPVGTPPRRRTFENDFHKTKPPKRFVPTHTKAYCSMKTCFIFENQDNESNVPKKHP
jgi:hypothetical protein